MSTANCYMLEYPAWKIIRRKCSTSTLKC